MNSGLRNVSQDNQDLQEIVDSLVSENDLLSEKNIELERRIEALESELRLQRIRRFQSQSEVARGLLDELGGEQGELFPEALQALIEELGLKPGSSEPEVKVASHTRKPRKPRQLDESLPRVEVVYELDNPHCDQCGNEMECIGHEPPLEQLAIAPAKHFVIRHIRKKYACECKRCIKRADMPAQPIPKSQASPQLLAYLMVSKFLDGLPLYRLEKILARCGLLLSRQNMARWFIQCCIYLDLLIQAFESKLLSYDIIFADETRLQVLHEPGREATQKSWLRIRRGGPPDEVVILIDYDSSRGGEVPGTLLEPFKDGYLIVDAYSGYKKLAADNKLLIVGCNDHARRKFKEAFDSLPTKLRQSKQGIAYEAIERYKALYKIERLIKDFNTDTKKRIRQEQSLPLFKDFKTWLETVKHQGVAHQKTAEAIQYFLNQYDSLIRYCEDGRLPISNILSEHVAKSIAIARKNFLFANTQSGAHAAAKIYSVILTSVQHGLDPIQYLTMVLTQLPGIKKHQSIEHLLPWNVTREEVKAFVDSLPSI